MKLLVAFAAVVAVAVAVPVQRQLINPGATGPTLVVDETGAPIDFDLQPISVGPAIMPSPISNAPAVIDFPLPDGGAISAPGPVGVVSPSPSPVVIGDIPAGAPSPLVQIIVNVNGQASPAPVDAPIVEPIVPGPVNVVDTADVPVNPIQVATPVIVDPIQVATPVIVDPIQVATPVIINPVEVGSPIIPSPAVNLPDILN